MRKRHVHISRKDISYYKYLLKLVVIQLAIKYSLIERKDDE